MSRRVKITFGTFVSFQSWQNGSYRIPVLAHRSSVSVSPLHSAKPWGGSRSERESHVRQRSQTSPPTLLTLLSTNTKGKISDGSCNTMPKGAIIQVVYFIRDGSTVSLAHLCSRLRKDRLIGVWSDDHCLKRSKSDSQEEKRFANENSEEWFRAREARYTPRFPSRKTN